MGMWIFYFLPLPYPSSWSGIPFDSSFEIFIFMFLCFITFTLKRKPIARDKTRLLMTGLLAILLLKILMGVLVLPTGWEQKIYPGEPFRETQGFAGSLKYPRKPYTFREASLEAPAHFLNDRDIVDNPMFQTQTRESFPFYLEIEGLIRPEGSFKNIFLLCDRPTSVTVNNFPLSAVGQHKGFFFLGTFSEKDGFRVKILQKREGIEKVSLQLWKGGNERPEKILKQVEIFPLSISRSPFRIFITRKIAPIVQLLIHLIFGIWIFFFLLYMVDWNEYREYLKNDIPGVLVALGVFLLILFYPVKRETMRPGILSGIAGIIVFSGILFVCARIVTKKWKISPLLITLFLGSTWFLISWKGASLMLHMYGSDPILIAEGTDGLAFETLAREIILKDILNRSEAPFWCQPFYRWALAGFHVLFGESVVWGFIAYWMLYGLTLVILFRLTTNIFSLGAGIAGIAMFLAAFFKLKYFYWISSLYPCILGQFLLLLGVYYGVLWLQNVEDKKKAFISGLFIGWAILTRTNFLLILPGLGIWAIGFWIVRKKSKTVFIGLSLLAMGTGLFLGASGFRNWILSRPHRFTLLIDNRNAGTILLTAFSPPKEPAEKELADNSFYNSFHLSMPFRRTLHTWIRYPLLCLSYMADRIRVMFGLPPKVEEFNRNNYPGFNFMLLFIWITVIIGWLLHYKKWWNAKTSFVLCFIIMQFAAMAFLGLNTGNYRLVIPMFTLLFVFSGAQIYHFMKGAWGAWGQTLPFDTFSLHLRRSMIHHPT